jgi:hypothetical protein
MGLLGPVDAHDVLTDPMQRGAFGPARRQRPGLPDARIAEDRPIELRPDCHDGRAPAQAAQRLEHNQRAMARQDRAPAGDRIAQELEQIPQRRRPSQRDAA